MKLKIITIHLERQMHLRLGYNIENKTNLNRGLNGLIFPDVIKKKEKHQQKQKKMVIKTEKLQGMKYKQNEYIMIITMFPRLFI